MPHIGPPVPKSPWRVALPTKVYPYSNPSTGGPSISPVCFFSPHRPGLRCCRRRRARGRGLQAAGAASEGAAGQGAAPRQGQGEAEGGAAESAAGLVTRFF